VVAQQEGSYNGEDEGQSPGNSSNINEDTDNYFDEETDDWEGTSLHLLNEAFPRQHVWRDEEELDESPLRSIVRDDLVLLFGEDWDDELYQGWEATVDGEDGDEDPFEGYDYRPPAVDKYFRNLLDVIKDPDCMEGEVDMNSPDFAVEKSIRLWHKCHVLVIRNAFANVADEFRSNVTSFVHDLNAGRINDNGTTSYSEPVFIHDTNLNRWDILMPKSLANHPQVLAPPMLMQILKDERVLGETFKALSFGLVLAEPDASSQPWHEDELPMFGDSSVYHNKHGGHEQPAVSIVALAPLLNMTRAHGPTEFCMGSSSVNGMFVDRPDFMNWDSQELKEEVMEVIYEGHDPEDFLHKICPSAMCRSPMLNAGDIILWDYNLYHRAGPNESEDFRTAMYTSAMDGSGL
jgi:hypothetical protein